MHIKREDVAAIVLTLVDELQIGPNGKITPELLLETWPQVGLRNSDLEDALQVLLDQAAFIKQELEDRRSCYVLTETGHKRMLNLNSPLTFGLASYQRLRRHAERRKLERAQAYANANPPEITNERRTSVTRH